MSTCTLSQRELILYFIKNRRESIQRCEQEIAEYQDQLEALNYRDLGQKLNPDLWVLNYNYDSFDKLVYHHILVDAIRTYWIDMVTKGTEEAIRLGINPKDKRINWIMLDDSRDILRAINLAEEDYTNWENADLPEFLREAFNEAYIEEYEKQLRREEDILSGYDSQEF